MFNRSILFSLLLMASCSKSGGDSNAQGDMLRPTQEEGAAGAPVTSSCPPGEEAACNDPCAAVHPGPDGTCDPNALCGDPDCHVDEGTGGAGPGDDICAGVRIGSDGVCDPDALCGDPDCPVDDGAGGAAPGNNCPPGEEEACNDPCANVFPAPDGTCDPEALCGDPDCIAEDPCANVRPLPPDGTCNPDWICDPDCM